MTQPVTTREREETPDDSNPVNTLTTGPASGSGTPVLSLTASTIVVGGLILTLLAGGAFLVAGVGRSRRRPLRIAIVTTEDARWAELAADAANRYLADIDVEDVTVTPGWLGAESPT